jgi:hypothetical protein
LEVLCAKRNKLLVSIRKAVSFEGRRQAAGDDNPGQHCHFF